MQSNKELIEYLKSKGAISTKRIERAFLAIDRIRFVPFRYVEEAYKNYPLPIGEGQTISQPETVAFMLEKLEIKRGDEILEIGAGSGWVTALLSFLVGKKGRVYSYEINAEVGGFGLGNLSTIRLEPNYHYRVADAKSFWGKDSPYDRIISAAAFGKVGGELISHLSPGGVLLVPTAGNYILKIKKTKNDKIEKEIFTGYIFVPLS